MTKFESLVKYIKKNYILIVYILIVILIMSYIYNCKNIYTEKENFIIDTKYVGEKNKVKIECIDENGVHYYMSYKAPAKCIGVEINNKECSVGIPILVPIGKYVECDYVCAETATKCQTDLTQCLADKTKFIFTIQANIDGTYKLFLKNKEINIETFLSQSLLMEQNIGKLCFLPPGYSIKSTNLDFVPVTSTDTGNLTSKYYIVFKSPDPTNDKIIIDHYVTKCDISDGGICTADDGNYVRLCLTSDISKALTFSFSPLPASGIL